MAYELKSITPEQAGIPSSAVAAFLDRIEERGIVLHSLLLVKDGNLLTEAYWKPFDRDFRHRLYSSSKSFVSVAIGILLGEGKISLDDKAVKFFPDKVTEETDFRIKMMTVRDLLRMTTPYSVGATYSRNDPDWADTFFNNEFVDHYPGTVFSYNTTATTMLCMIIKRVTGQDFTEYLSSRLFAPLGMAEDIACIKTPCGYDWGGSGVLCTSRDFARFATICLNMGSHEGKQLIPEEYMREATSKQTENRSTQTHPENSQGYGYQFWCLRNGGFATLGMGCQISLNFPKYGFSLIATGDTQAIGDGYTAYVITSFFDILFPHIEKNCTLPENPTEQNALQAKISELSVACVKGALSSPVAEKINGREYRLKPSKSGISRLKFAFEGDEGTMYYTNATGDHSIRFGFGHQVRSEFPETHYFGDTIGVPSGKGYDIITSAAWGMENSLLIDCYAIDKYFGTLKINAVFRENLVTIYMQKSAEHFFEEYKGFACGETE